MKARERTPVRRVIVATAADAERVVRPLMHAEQETFVVVCIDIRNRMVHEPMVIAMGTAHSVEVHPRDVFREAIRRNAAGVILAHNHPTGDATPSREDVELTARMVAAGTLLGIPAVDHVVIGDGPAVSMREGFASVFEP